MADGIRISQLPSITALTDDDTLIINDGNSATSRITYANFKTSISSAISGVNTINGQSGDVVIDATTLGVYTVQQVNDLVDTKASNALIGVVNGAADLGPFAGSTIPANSTVRSALQSLETAVESGDAQDAILSGDNTFTGTNTFQGTITAGMTGNVVPFYFDSQVQFPSAAVAHGAVAHSHSDGKMYYAHGGAWIELANAADVGTIDPANYYTITEVDSALADKLDNAGGSVTGPLDAQGGLTVSGLTAGGAALSADGTVTASGAKLGTDLGSVAVPFIATNDEDVATKKYVDDAITAGGTVDLSGYYTSAEVDTALNDYYTKTEVDNSFSSYYTSAQVDTALGEKVDSTELTTTLADYSTTTEADALYATATQGTTADTALQPEAIGVSVQAYDANTVVDASYATVQSGAAAGATALQSETIDLTTLKSTVANSADYAAFQAAIAAL